MNDTWQAGAVVLRFYEAKISNAHEQAATVAVAGPFRGAEEASRALGAAGWERHDTCGGVGFGVGDPEWWDAPAHPLLCVEWLRVEGEVPQG